VKCSAGLLVDALGGHQTALSLAAPAFPFSSMVSQRISLVAREGTPGRERQSHGPHCTSPTALVLVLAVILLSSPPLARAATTPGASPSGCAADSCESVWTSASVETVTDGLLRPGITRPFEQSLEGWAEACSAVPGSDDSAVYLQAELWNQAMLDSHADDGYVRIIEPPVGPDPFLMVNWNPGDAASAISPTATLGPDGELNVNPSSTLYDLEAFLNVELYSRVVRAREDAPSSTLTPSSLPLLPAIFPRYDPIPSPPLASSLADYLDIGG